MEVNQENSSSTRLLKLSSSSHVDEDDAASQAVKQTVEQDVFIYFQAIKPKDKQLIIKSWQVAYKSRDKLCKYYETSFLSDKELMQDAFVKKMLETIQISLIIDAYNSIIQFLNDDHTNENDVDDKTTERTDSHTGFQGLYSFLTKIGYVHKRLGIDKKELLVARVHLLRTLKKWLGAGWTPEINQSWIKLTNLVQIGIMSAFKLSAEPLQQPTNESFEICRDTWKFVTNNLDKAYNILWKEMTAHSEDIIQFFPTPQSLAPLGGFTRLLNLTHDPQVLTETLKSLGAQHVQYGVQRRHFTIIFKAWFVMLKQILGVQYTPTTCNAWRSVFTFMSRIMQDSLDDAWMLSMPQDADEIKLNVCINQVDNIDPVNFSFYANVSVSASNSNVAINENIWKSSKHSDDKKQKNIDSSNDNQTKNVPKWNIHIANARKTQELFHKTGKKTLIESSDGVFYSRSHITGSFSQNYSMQHFPFDKHKLKLQIRLNCDASKAKFSLENVQIKMIGSNYGGKDWQMFEPYIHVCKQKKSASGISGGAAYESYCNIIMPIARRTKSQFSEVLLPLFLIELLGLGSYYVESEPIFYRMTTMVTLLLTMFAFKWTVSKSLPVVPYLTYLDYHFNVAYFFFFLHCVCNGLFIQTLQKTGHYSTIKDQFSAACVVALFCIVKIKISITGWRILQKQDKFRTPQCKQYTALKTVEQAQKLGLLG